MLSDNIVKLHLPQSWPQRSQSTTQHGTRPPRRTVPTVVALVPCCTAIFGVGTTGTSSDLQNGAKTVQMRRIHEVEM
jgi:hypothetical protein